jgi:hypothetical protein
VHPGGKVGAGLERIARTQGLKGGFLQNVIGHGAIAAEQEGVRFQARQAGQELGVKFVRRAIFHGGTLVQPARSV